MTFISYNVCDVCRVQEVRTLLPAFRKVAVSDQMADVCSIECAQVWVAEEFERLVAVNPANASPTCNRQPDGDVA